jgi:hypothetical protein
MLYLDANRLSDLKICKASWIIIIRHEYPISNPNLTLDSCHNI